MSTVKTNNVQIGQSVTATNNGTWYQPATPDGTIRYGIGNAGATTSDVVTLSSSGLSATALIPSGSTAPTNGMFLPTTNTLAWSTNSTERLRLDSSGNLGLGVTPSAWYSTLKAIQIGGTASVSHLNAGVGNQQANYGNNFYYNASGVETYIQSTGAQRYRQLSGAGHIWEIAPSGTAGNAISFTQAMTLDASGILSNISYIKAGTYLWAAGDTSSGGIYLGSAGANNARIGQNSFGTGTTTTYIGNAAITTSSDVRLKENIEDTKRNAIEILGNLRVVDHTWNDPTDTCENNRNSRGVWMGLIAQEAIDHIPWLVNKPLSDEDEEGRPQYWHMDYGYFVPLLVKAIQELSAKNSELESRLAALENK